MSAREGVYARVTKVIGAETMACATAAAGGGDAAGGGVLGKAKGEGGSGGEGA